MGANRLIHYWKPFVAFAIPIVLLPLILKDDTKEMKCAYSMMVIIGYWITEAIPLPVASLLPVVLYPLLGVLDASVLCKEYLKDALMVFVGGMMVAMAIESSNLHKRIALKVMILSGGSLQRVMLGAMLTTMWLSMWMSNTSCTSMMVCPPYILSMKAKNAGVALQRMSDETTFLANWELDNKEEMLNLRHKEGQLRDEQKKWISNVRTMLYLSICYSANIGGTGTVSGTGTNLLALQLLQNLDPKHHGDYAALTYGTWIAFSFVPMLVNTLISWFYLQLIFLTKWSWMRGRSKSKQTKADDDLLPDISEVKALLLKSYEELGEMSEHEITVSVCTCSALFVWILHDPKFIPGWSDLLTGGAKSVSIATATMIVGTVFLTFPRNLRDVFANGAVVKPLVEWDYAVQHLPWGIVIFFGGSLALSAGAKSSGLTRVIGQYLLIMSKWSPWVIQIFTMFVISFVTEIVSNAATASIAIPILLDLSKELGIHPLYLTLPTALSCSYAFMLPIATTSNTLVYSTGGIKLIDMIRTGFLMNLSSVLVLYGTTNTLGNLLFHFNNYVYTP